MTMQQEIFKKYWIHAKKSLWQNFLLDEWILESIAQSISVVWKNIIEIWPWYGALTEKICTYTPQTLTLVELDDRMVEILEDRKKEGDFCISPETLFYIHHGDVLEFIPEQSQYSIIANIPYYITSPILRHFLYNTFSLPLEMVILMQKDVADKILMGSQKQKKSKSSVLSLFCEKKMTIQKVCDVAPQCFFPAPKVESSVLLFTQHQKYAEISDESFLSYIKSGFKEPRKKLFKNLLQAGVSREKLLWMYEKYSLDENMRAEEWNIDFWIDLTLELQE